MEVVRTVFVAFICQQTSYDLYVHSFQRLAFSRCQVSPIPLDALDIWDAATYQAGILTLSLIHIYICI